MENNDDKKIKIPIELVGIEEVKKEVDGLIAKLKEANSLADELAKKHSFKSTIQISLDGKEIAKRTNSL